MTNVTFLRNVYISISISYFNSKFGISSKKNVFFFISYSQTYIFAFYMVWQRNMLVKARLFQCLSFNEDVGLQVLTFYQAGVQGQVGRAGFRLERCFDV